MGFNLIRDKNAGRLLQTYLAQDKSPHFLIFHGDKEDSCLAAWEWASVLNCQNSSDDGTSKDSCGSCVSCKKIKKKLHPDVQMVDWEYQAGLETKSAGTEQRLFKIGTVRSLERRFFFPPFEGKKCVIMMEPAQMLTEDAANAMLKMLEEPPTWISLILICDEPSKLLSTIRSRAQLVHFSPPPISSQFAPGETNKPSADLSELPGRTEQIIEYCDQFGVKGHGRSAAEEMIQRLLDGECDLLHSGDESAVRRMIQLTGSLEALRRNVSPRLVMETLFFERMAKKTA